MERAKFTKVRFARDGSNTLFAGMNLGRDASYLAAYVLDDAQDQSTWRLAKKVKVDDGPNSCLEVSKSGAMVGMGQTNGRLMVSGAVWGGSGAWMLVCVAMCMGQTDGRLMVSGTMRRWHLMLV